MGEVYVGSSKQFHVVHNRSLPLRSNGTTANEGSDLWPTIIKLMTPLR